VDFSLNAGFGLADVGLVLIQGLTRGPHRRILGESGGAGERGQQQQVSRH
jgi:hypothetical protein